MSPSRSPAATTGRRDQSRALRHARSPDPETAPLLPKEKPKTNPLPKAQLAVIYAIKLSVPIAMTQLSPYFNLLIEKLAASDGAETGYYSGLSVGILKRVISCNLRSTIRHLVSSPCSIRRSLSACLSGDAHLVCKAPVQFVLFSLLVRIDIIGRVPVIILGTSGTALLSVMLGMSDTLSGVLLNRLVGECFHLAE